MSDDRPGDPAAGWRIQRDHARERVRAQLFGGAAATPVTLGRFRLAERLGSGGMGVVYRAHDPELDRHVALKVVRSEALASAMANDAGLLREAKAMARIAHPNVATVFEVGEEGGSVFVAMELVEGGTLREWLANRPRSVGEALDVIVAAGQGLSAAHERGLVHGDVKPDNVLVGNDGRPRVVDFGLARLTLAAGGRTQTGPMVRFGGTPGYMAPEQLRGEMADSLSDQFALAATAFEALFSRRPFDGTTPEEQLAAIAGGPVAPSRHAASHLVPALSRGMAFEPRARFATVAALLDALERAERRRRRRATMLRGALVLLPLSLMAAAGGWWALGRSKPADDEGMEFAVYAELSDMIQEGRFRECVKRSLREEPTPQLLTMRIECARAAGDDEALARACAELRERFDTVEAPAACDDNLAKARALREAGAYRECIDFIESVPPTVPLKVEMHRCASPLRDRATFVRVCRYAAKHFPDMQKLEDCPKPLADHGGERP